MAQGQGGGGGFGDFLKWLSGAIGSPLGQLGLGALSIPAQNRAQRESEAATDRQIADSLGIASQIGPSALAVHDDSAKLTLEQLLGSRDRGLQGADDYLGAMGDREQSILDFLRDRSSSITQGYQDRYNTAEREIAGFGRQMREDTDTLFDQREEENTAFRTQRGINSTTAATSGRTLNDSQRNKEQRRIGEQIQAFRRGVLDPLSGQTLTAHTGLTGDIGNAQGRLSADTLGAQRYGIDLDRLLSGDIANFYSNNAINRSNITSSGYRDMLGALTGINYVPPGPNPYPAIYGQNSVDPADPSKATDSSAPWIQAGGAAAGAAAATGLGALFAGGGGTALAASMVVMICITRDSIIKCLGGNKPLGDIRIGDYVFNADGKLSMVVGKHLGEYRGDWSDEYARIRFSDGRNIVASMNHIIEGRTVGEWVASGEVEVSHPGDRRSSGDLLLEDESDYIANGLRITSLIRHSDLPALMELEPDNQVVAHD